MSQSIYYLHVFVWNFYQTSQKYAKQAWVNENLWAAIGAPSAERLIQRMQSVCIVLCLETRQLKMWQNVLLHISFQRYMSSWIAFCVANKSQNALVQVFWSLPKFLPGCRVQIPILIDHDVVMRPPLTSGRAEYQIQRERLIASVVCCFVFANDWQYKHAILHENKNTNIEQNIKTNVWNIEII